MKFESMAVCVDMHGCPNRCRHCWLGHSPNGNLSVNDLVYIAEQFSGHAEEFEIYDWYREPDYADNYKEMWDITQSLSTHTFEHFELISFWRAARDNEYVKWLSSLGVSEVQLTVFGDDKTTDYFTGRRGAYREILNTIDILLENGIAPRIQAFVNKTNLDKLQYILDMIDNTDLINRCRKIGKKFKFFMHQGSCDGENEKFYEQWITVSDIAIMPQGLIDMSMKYFGLDRAADIFGRPESELTDELLTDTSTYSMVSASPAFYVDSGFNVYPNYSAPSEFYFLGNLKRDGAEKIIDNYVNNKSAAQHIMVNTEIREIAGACGNLQSSRLFLMGDYKRYLYNSFFRKHKESRFSLN